MSREKEPELEVGDWIQFVTAGKTVIDEVIMLSKDSYYPYCKVAYTPHNGIVYLRSVIKVKRASL